MFHVADDTDDETGSWSADNLLAFLRNAAVERDSLADHVGHIGPAHRSFSGGGPVVARHRFADDHDELAAVDVVRVEIAAHQQRDAHGLKVSRRRRSSLRRESLSVWPRMIFDLNASAVVIAAERQDVHGARGGDTRQCAHTFLETLVERHLLAFLVSRRRQRHFHREHFVRGEAGIDLLQVPQTPNQQAGSDQKHDRHRHLGDDQQLAGAAGRAGGVLPSAVLERIVQVLSRQLERRQQAEDHAGGKRCEQRKDQRRRIEADLIRARHTGRGQRGERARRPECQQQSADRADEGERQAFGQHLAHQSAAIGADRRAQRQLAQASSASREQQVGHVGACHEQHQSDRSGQQRKHRPCLTDHRVEQRCDEDALIGIADREVALEASGDGVEFGARLLDRHAVLQPGDAANKMAAAIGLRGTEAVGREDVGAALGIDLDVTIARRQHADDSCGPRVQRDRSADDRRIGAEAAAPEAIAQDDCHLGIGRVVLGAEDAAEGGLNAERRKESRRHVHAADALGLALPAADREEADKSVRARPFDRSSRRAGNPGSRPARDCRWLRPPCRSRGS